MRITLCYWILLFCLPASGQMQWQTLDSGTQASLRGISVVDKQVIWASGSAATVIRSLDGGITWQRRPINVDQAMDFRDIQAFSADEAIIMSAGPGSQSRLYITEDGGSHWRLLQQNTHAEGFYDGMAFWDRQHGILYGDPIADHFFVMHSDDGGEHWQETEPDHMPRALPGEHAYAASGSGIAVAAGGHAWFVTGGSRARVFHSHDHGRHWQVSDSPLISNSDSAGIFSIAFADPDRGIIVGGDYQRRQDAYANVAHSNDGGKSWRLAKSLPVGLRSAVTYIDAQHLLTVGSHGSDYSLDGGTHWIGISDQGYYALDRHGDTAWAVGAEGRAGRIQWPPKTAE